MTEKRFNSDQLPEILESLDSVPDNSTLRKIDSDTMGSAGTIVYKTADESVSGSPGGDTLQDDDHLYFNVGAGEVWQFEAALFVFSSGNTPDIKISLDGPASPDYLRAHVSAYDHEGVGSRDLDDPGILADYSEDASMDWGTAPDSNGTILYIRGVLENGVNAGTFTVQWAQRVASVTATTVKRGSYMIGRRIS